MIICVGEILVDIFAKQTKNGTDYEKKCGGAPFNVACGIKNLGGHCGFYGCVGSDENGKFLLSYAQNANFDFLKIDTLNGKMTTHTIVYTSDTGERSFDFFRGNASDYNLNVNQIDTIIQNATICHIGSLMLSEKCGQNFVDNLIFRCKQKNIKLSFDVNYREKVFNSKTEAKSILLKYAKMMDIVKISDDELKFLSGESDYKKGLNNVFGTSDKLIYLTMGSKGSMLYHNGKIMYAFPLNVSQVDTTGAGDAFLGGVLYELDKKSELKMTLITGNVCGAITCTKKGATNCFESYNQVKKYFNQIKVESYE